MLALNQRLGLAPQAEVGSSWFDDSSYLLGTTAPNMIADFNNQRYMVNGSEATFSDIWNTFTSTAGGAYTDSDSNPQTAGTNEPRIDYSSGVGELMIQNAQAENCKSGGTAFSAYWDNTGANTFYIDARTPTDNDIVAHVDSGWLFEKLLVQTSGTDIVTQIRTNVSPTGTLTSTIASGGAAGDRLKAAVRLDNNDWGSAVNGTLGLKDASKNLPVGIQWLRLGQSYNSTVQTDVRIREVRCYPVTGSDAEIQTLTTI